MEKGSQETVSTNPQTEEYLLKDETLISGLKHMVTNYISACHMAKRTGSEPPAPITVKVYQKSTKEPLGNAELLLSNYPLLRLTAQLGNKPIQISTYGDYYFLLDKKTLSAAQEYKAKIDNLDSTFGKSVEPEPDRLIHLPLSTYMNNFCKPVTTKPPEDDDEKSFYSW